MTYFFLKVNCLNKIEILRVRLYGLLGYKTPHEVEQ